MPSFSRKRHEIGRLVGVRRVFLSSVAIVATAGCTILSGVADLEATRDGTDKVDGAADGAVIGQPSVDGSVSTSIDASTADVATQTPLDSGSDVVAPTKNFCDGVTAFACFDYEGTSINPSTAEHVNSTISVDGPGHDSMNALHCVGKDDLGAQCFHTVALPESPKKIHYRFDFLIESPGTATEMNEIEFTYDVGKCAIQPSFVGSAAQVNEFCPDQGTPDQVNHDVGTIDLLASSAWYTFDITLDLVNHTLSGSFTKPSGATPFGPITLDARFVTSPKVALHAGMSFGAKATPAAKVRVDNVSLDLP